MILALAVHTAKRLGEIGFLIGAIGALLLLVDGVGSGSTSRTTPFRGLAGLLMAAGFVLGIAFIHWG